MYIAIRNCGDITSYTFAQIRLTLIHANVWRSVVSRSNVVACTSETSFEDSTVITHTRNASSVIKRQEDVPIIFHEAL